MKKLKKKQFEELYAPMEEELVAMARWAAKTGARIVVLFEGRDTAGKGGAIKAVAGPLNPRQCRVVALSKPSDQEKTQWYFQRYVAHLPSAGEVVLFDRSWYNRAGVERVMGYCSEDQAKAFLKAVPEFEDLLIKDGILLFKYWLTTIRLARKNAGRAAGRSAEALEALADRSGRAREVRRLYRGARGDARPPQHPTRPGPWSISTTSGWAG
jgi:polyphosphate kinase 2 (PPK2 family)